MGHKAKLATFAVWVALWFTGAWGWTLLAHASDATSQSGMIRLDSPRANDQLTSGTVEVRYQRIEDSATPPVPPTFRIQLDSGDPITTQHTTCLLTGLAPGTHSLTITLLDASGTPVPSSSVSAQFTVLPSAQHETSPAAPGEVTVSQAPPPSPDSHNSNSRALPILSIIGFGVLVGGIFSAMRTR